MRKILVEASTTYEVLIEKGLLAGAGAEIAKVLSPCKAAIITDSHVAGLYEKTMRQSLEDAGFTVCTFIFEAGEESKHIGTLGDMVEFLAEQEMTRGDIIVALGGGVVGDMAGFCAAIYQRGIPFVQIPTTLLAMVDSSVGGKTAIDLKAGKNLAGAFYQPRLVLCDTSALNTLPDEIFADGMAEVIKYGVIGNAALFEQVKNGNVRDDMDEIVEACVSMKRDIVMKDEFDTGERQVLNLGHTFGHSIEKNSNFTISHGKAVAMGLVLIAQAAEAKGMCKEPISGKIKEALKKNGLPIETAMTPKEIAQGTMVDKKRRGGAISFVFPTKIGECVIEKVPVEQVEALAKNALKGG